MNKKSLLVRLYRWLKLNFLRGRRDYRQHWEDWQI